MVTTAPGPASSAADRLARSSTMRTPVMPPRPRPPRGATPRRACRRRPRARRRDPPARTDRPRPRRTLDLLACSRQLVQASPAHLHRRDHRRELLDVADEAREGTLDVAASERHRSLVDDLAGGVERAGGDAEHDPTLVGLARFRE